MTSVASTLHSALVADSIPLYDVIAERARLADGYRAAFERVMASGRFVGGPETTAFEQELGQLCGGHAALVRSGTDAVTLALRALDIGPGDEVVTSAYTFIATAEAILHCGAVPVFADVEPESLCISARTCAPLITSRTSAILAVHLFGHCSDMDAMGEFCRSHGLALVEDAAQAVGSTWRGRMLGTIGEAGAFSFYPTKNLPALGNGGAVVARNASITQAARSLATHGVDKSGRHSRLGHNSRPDELQAAFLRVALESLGRDNETRRAIAARYDTELPTELRRVRGDDGCASNCHQYAVRSRRCQELGRFLARAGIGIGDYYRTPLHRELAIEKECHHSGLSETECACGETLTLPVRPSLTEEEQTAVITAARRFFN